MNFLSISLVLGCLLPLVVSDYVAGVVNHDVFFGTGSDAPAYLLDTNLQMYENLTIVAGNKGVQVLVFPEFGLEPVQQASRTDLYSYAEAVPSVTDNLVTPCDEADIFVDRPILFRLSCAAKKSALLLLVNMVDSQTCDASTDTNCPEDGRYLYNTDVLFDESGSIVAKYHKTHVWLSNLDKYNEPVTTEYVTYKSPTIGVEFGLFICFDIVFPDPAKVLVERGVKHFLYAVQQGFLGDATLMPIWSDNQDAALLASNLQMSGKNGGTKEDVSRVFVKGKTLDGKKYAVDRRGSFPNENVLVVTVPTEF